MFGIVRSLGFARHDMGMNLNENRTRRAAWVVMAAIVLLLTWLGSGFAHASEGANGDGCDDKAGECITVYGYPPPPENPDSTGDPDKGSTDAGSGSDKGNNAERQEKERQAKDARDLRAALLNSILDQEAACPQATANRNAAISRYSEATVAVGYAERALSIERDAQVLGVLKAFAGTVRVKSADEAVINAVFEGLAYDIASRKVDLAEDRYNDAWNKMLAAQAEVDSAVDQYFKCVADYISASGVFSPPNPVESTEPKVCMAKPTLPICQ